MANKTQFITEPGKQELFINREFNASPDLVFKAFNEPELIMQWMGPKGYQMKIEKFDSKSHGSWRFFHYDEKGNKFAFNGVIHEVSAPERIIRTFEFEGLPTKGHVSLEFINFQMQHNGFTRVNIQVVFKSIHDRDAMIQSGMEKGVIESYERLDQLLKNNYNNKSINKNNGERFLA